MENPFSTELKALADTSLPAWAAESDQGTPRQPMKNEETKGEAPRLKLDKGLPDPSPTGQSANSGEESKGPFEATNTPITNKKATTPDALQINADLSDQDSDEDIVPGEGD